MPYGGPRFEFFTQNQYNNHTASILKEDATRAAAIHQRAEAEKEAKYQQSTRETQQARRVAAHTADEESAAAEAHALRGRRQQAERRKAAAEHSRHRLGRQHAGSGSILGDSTARGVKGTARRAADAEGTSNASAGRLAFAGSARVLALSQPRPREEPGYGALMYGRCMHQSTREVEFPQGRDGQPYLPGVDRDRLLPTHHDLSAPPPWEGSYSTNASIRQGTGGSGTVTLGELRASQSGPGAVASARKEATSWRSPAQLSELQRSCNGTARGLPLDSLGGMESSIGGPNGEVEPHGSAAAGEESCGSSGLPSPSVAPSVVSHGSSCGPIEATGTKHMIAEPPADFAQVSLHLSRYGGAMTATSARARDNAQQQQQPRRGAEPSSSADAMTLPELSYRVVHFQNIGRKSGP